MLSLNASHENVLDIGSKWNNKPINNTDDNNIVPMHVTTIGIAGGSGSGKTTLARMLFEKLGGETKVVYLVHDDYYKDLSHKSAIARKKTNFDDPDSLDTELLVQHIKDLKKGKRIQIPQYDFRTHCRVGKTVEIEPKEILLVEGVLIFTNPGLLKEMDIKIFTDADANTRLSRRLARDTRERGRSTIEVKEQYHATVRPMHEKWVEPSKKEADIVINTEMCGLDEAVEKCLQTTYYL